MPSLFYAGQPDYIEKLNTLATAASMTNGTVAASFLSLAVTGTATAASFVGPLTGNASTATTLATARNINGVSFNGSADITVTAAAGTLTGTTLAAGVTASSLTSVGALTALTTTGSVGIGGAAPATTVLRLSKQGTGGTIAFGQDIQTQVQSDVTNSYSSVRSVSSTAATAFTLSQFNHFSAVQGVIGAGSTVTNQMGFEAQSSLTGAANNFGFYSNLASGTGRWNFYAAGTADNYFAGKVGIGTTALTNYSFLNGLALTGQTTMIGNGTVAQVNSDVTSLAVGYRSNLYTQAASFNCSAFYGFHAVQSTLGASSSVSFQAGFLAGSTLTGATSNYGFYSEIASGANRYNFYAAGTAPNYFAGVTGIGVAPASTSNLTVAASTTAVSSLNIPHGAAPTSPVNGDMWTTTAGLFIRINGATVGPLS